MTNVKLEILGKSYLFECDEAQSLQLQRLGQQFNNRCEKLIEGLGEVSDSQVFLSIGLGLLEEVNSSTHTQASGQGNRGESLTSQDFESLQAHSAQLMSSASDKIEEILKLVGIDD